MSTAVQRRRGTTAEHSSFAGLLSELTVDTTKKVVVVHDGSTTGGFALARENLSNVTEASLASKLSTTLGGYVTTASAASTYQSIAGMTSYLTTATAASTYQTTAGMSSYLTSATAASTYAGLATAQTFTAAQRGTVSAQSTVSGTVTLNFATANNFSMTLSAGTVTLANPTNLTAGQSGAITITQDSGTARSLVFGGYFKFEAGTPTITTTLGALSTLFYYVDSSTRITAKLITNPTGA
jgi:hypothetical protein